MKRHDPHHVTIAFIAQQVGVSVPTVSKVINGRPDVSPSTRERVEAAIREHGYQRPEKPSHRASLLELVFHELDSPWALEIIRGVEGVARSAGHGVVISQLHGRLAPEAEWVQSALSHRPAGVISAFSELTHHQRSQLAARGIPYVTIDPSGEPLQDAPSVGATNWSGGIAATRHLLELGHRRVAMIGGPEEILCARARMDGYRAAMDAARLDVAGLLRRGDMRVRAGFTLGRDLLALPAPPTAIFTSNDLQALGVYDAARAAGARIPDDVSVVGFDDLPLACWIGPALTTVRQPLVEMATTATELLLDLVRGRHPQHTRVELATELVVRQSTAPPR